MIAVVEPGPFTTVQDEGRPGWQAFGMPPAGAMDRYAYRVANMLVGNRPGAAALEMTLRGGRFRFERPCLAALCGADMQAVLGGVPVANWSSFRARAGDELALDFAAGGCRAYLAVRGGIGVAPVLGSRSTDARAGIGGHEGRPLRAGDRLPLGTDALADPGPRRLDPPCVPDCAGPIRLRVLPGPQDDHFTAAGIETFFGSAFVVSTDSDRMGCRLDGPAIEHAGPVEIISDALVNGSVQIPGHGRPILLLADRQTAGGYPKIGTVIGPDLRLLAQARPGDTVRFAPCTEDEALAALRRERETCARIARALGNESDLLLRLHVTIAGESFQCEVREV